MNQEGYKKLISGNKKSLVAASIRFCLRLISLIYLGAVSIRNLLYDFRILRTSSVKVPVISIGNITAGGTGKTPLTIAICRMLCSMNKRPAVLTRGYKAYGKEALSDEPALIAKICPNVGVIVNPDRYKGALNAIAVNNCNVLVLDDGFQHRKLYRNLDIVVIDATVPFGYGKILPAGLLRESLKSLKRAHAAVISRCDNVDQAAIEKIEKIISRINPVTILIRSSHRPVSIFANDGKQLKLSQLKNTRVVAVSGIGNPQSFEQTLRLLGCHVAEHVIFDDHHSYSPAEIVNIEQKARDHVAQFVITTEKDWTKLPLPQMGSEGIIFACLTIELQITKNAELLKKLLETTVA